MILLILIIESPNLWSNIFVILVNFTDHENFCHEIFLTAAYSTGRLDTSKSQKSNESRKSGKFMTTEIWSYTVSWGSKEAILYVNASSVQLFTDSFYFTVMSTNKGKAA